MDFDVQVRVAVYGHFAETGQAPTPEDVVARLGSGSETSAGVALPLAVFDAYRRLRALRVLVLEKDGSSIRMAPPFSGIPTQHVVESGGITYFANCAWDALGVPAALHRQATVHSRCEQSGDRLHLGVGLEGPEPSDWLFHSLVPAVSWWDDIVFT